MLKTALSDILRPMKGDLTIRTVRTASGATAVQIIQYANNKRIVVKHIGSARNDDELAALRCEAERVREELSPQLTLLPGIPAKGAEIPSFVYMLRTSKACACI